MGIRDLVLDVKHLRRGGFLGPETDPAVHMNAAG
jgi:hypothetical protein